MPPRGFKAAAIAAIRAHDELLAFWQGINDSTVDISRVQILPDPMRSADWLIIARA